MSKTQDKILRAARLLFNRDGVANVSQRNIASHIAISPGNLTYHFKKRQDIIDALFEKMSTELEDIRPQNISSRLALEEFAQWLKALYKVQFDHRYFLIDYGYIVHTSKNIKKEYIAMRSQRGKLFGEFLKVLLANGMLRKAELPKEYDAFIERFQLISDYWMLSVEGLTEEIMLKHTRVYTQNTLQALYPYLTEKGKTKYQELFLAE